MAEIKNSSRAEKAVSDVKKKNGSKTADSKSIPNTKKKKPAELPNEDNRIPGRVIFAVACLGLFILFLVMGVRPQGAILKFLMNILLGLIGKAAFYFMIPALLYMFIVTVSSDGQPIRMRCICLAIFTLLSSCVYHLMVNNQTLVGGIRVIADLWNGGISGTSGGLICGLAAMFLRWACGPVIAYIVFIVGAILTLLASMKITVPSIIRAIRNRPRDDWDDDFYEEKPEPAAMVVNHIANKHIEHKRAKRQIAHVEAEEQYFDEPEEFEQIPIQLPPKTRRKAMTVPELKEPAKSAKLFDVDSSRLRTPVPAAEQAAAEVPVRKDKVKLADLPVDDEPAVNSMPVFRPEDPIPETVKAPETPAAPSANAKVTAKEANESAQLVAAEIAQNMAAQKPVYCFPPIELLKRPSGNVADGTQEMKENSKRLNETLASFKIDAHIVNVTRGPSVTRYEVELDKGVRLNKLTTVADDIALSLGAPSVRIAPVPGKISVVGIEVPNRIVTNVNLREVIDSNEFNRSKSKSTFAVGKDIGGTCIVGNIAKMPHMLIAGTTGSGKSVCMNSIIISLLYKASPDEVKLIMVDPKMVELGIYNGIPHLLIPVVTDPKKAAGSLQWAVTEMMRRYKTMSDAGVRDLESYNSIVEAEGGQKVPQLVVIIDELADLMMVSSSQVEESICRLAQKARAAGMHLIVATQRPSVNVITGLIKANIPSRIAFAVTSQVDSRTILDGVGAEKLVGKGDMLFAPIGSNKPTRIQGTFISEDEVKKLIQFVQQQGEADEAAEADVLDTIEKANMPDAEKGDKSEYEDELLPDAIEFVVDHGSASVSMLQRRFRIGYNRAARIIDMMEERQIVGPPDGSRPRQVLLSTEDLENMKNTTSDM